MASVDTEYQLKIYVAGMTPDHQDDIVRLKRAMREYLGNSSLKVIDVMEQPHLADQDKILATPTVVRALPMPMKKFIFDLGSIEKILIGMDLIKNGE